MAWQIEELGITAEEKDELMSVGAMVVEEVRKNLTTPSSLIRTNFMHNTIVEVSGTGEGVTRSVEILLFFVITNLGESNEKQIEEFIHEHLLDAFSHPSMTKYKVQWAIAFEPKE